MFGLGCFAAVTLFAGGDAMQYASRECASAIRASDSEGDSGVMWDVMR